MENESESSYIFIHFVAKLTTRTPVLSKRINVWLLRFRIECSSWTSFFKVSVKENEVPTEKNSSRASIFATKASYISN